MFPYIAKIHLSIDDRSACRNCSLLSYWNVEHLLRLEFSEHVNRQASFPKGLVNFCLKFFLALFQSYSFDICFSFCDRVVLFKLFVSIATSF